MTERGPIGELPIHICLLQGGSQEQLKIFDFMLSKDPTLLWATYDDGERVSQYQGESLLHIAIIKKRADLVQMLLAREADLNDIRNRGKFAKLFHARATGSFFGVR